MADADRELDSSRHKRLLIAVDVYSWAWNWMAEGIRKYRPANVEVTIVDERELGVIRSKVPWMLNEFKGVSYCSWTSADLSWKPADTSERCPTCTAWLASHGHEYRFPSRDETFMPGRIATRNRNRRRAREILPKFDRLLCVSERIHAAAKEFGNCIRVTPGVDTTLFCEMPLANRERLIVGWCGQQAGVTKGYKEVLRPLQSQLGESVAWQVNCRDATNPLSQVEMADWYRGIDVFISTSCAEGFQMPVLEAAACGRPVISTDVGAAREVIEDGASGFIVSAYERPSDIEATVAKIRGALTKYCVDRALMKEHGQRARRIVEDRFDWKDRAAEWVEAML